MAVPSFPYTGGYDGDVWHNSIRLVFKDKPISCQSYSFQKDSIKEYSPPYVPLQVDYHLTQTGKTLLPLISAIDKWESDFSPRLKNILAAEVLEMS